MTFQIHLSLAAEMWYDTCTPIFSVTPFSPLPSPCCEPGPYMGVPGDTLLGLHVFPFIIPLPGAHLFLKPRKSLYIEDFQTAFIMPAFFYSLATAHLHLCVSLQYWKIMNRLCFRIVLSLQKNEQKAQSFHYHPYRPKESLLLIY